MNDLMPVEYQGQRILTTTQLAESYGTDEKRISENFTRNQDHYTEGKHYFLLQGELLKEFKSKSANCGIAPSVNKLYLWTEKGAWLHAKSLNTDKAWEAYEMLVDDYYRVKDALPADKPTKPLPTWDRTAISEIRFAKELAKAAGIRPERTLAVALAHIEKETGKQLGDYRKTLPAVKEEDAEILTPGQIGEQLQPQRKASEVNIILEEMGLQYGIREPGKKPGVMRLVKRNPWRLTEKGKEFGIMQDTASSGNKWEGFQIMWSAKTVGAVKEFLAKKGTNETAGGCDS